MEAKWNPSFLDGFSVSSTSDPTSFASTEKNVRIETQEKKAVRGAD